MAEIVDFADAKLPHARKRRDARAKAMKNAFAEARGVDPKAEAKKIKNKYKKNPKKKK